MVAPEQPLNSSSSAFVEVHMFGNHTQPHAYSTCNRGITHAVPTSWLPSFVFDMLVEPRQYVSRYIVHTRNKVDFQVKFG